jgi:hypothetical protein
VTGNATKKAGAENIDWAKPVTQGPQSLGFDYSYIIPASLDMDPYCWLENGRLVEAPTGRTPGSERRWSGGGGYWRAGAIVPSFDFYGVLPTVTPPSSSSTSNGRASFPLRRSRPPARGCRRRIPGKAPVDWAAIS